MRTPLLAPLILALVSACAPPEADGDLLADGGLTEPAWHPSRDAGQAERATPELACEATSPRTAASTVWPLPEAGEAPFVQVLSGAKSSIRVFIYLMGYGAILDTLTAKAKAGVEVRVVMDVGKASVNQKYHDQLKAAGAEVRWSNPKFPYMHAKVIIVDGKEALISTGNFSKSYSILLERNFLARVADPEDVSDLVALFDADWEQRTPELACTRLLVSPINAKQRLLALIDSARESLAVESMQLADSDVRARVAGRQAAGVNVRAILADSSWISANADAAAFLRAHGVEARTIPHCHVKAIIADGDRAYVGSENLSYTSLVKNREVGVVLTEAPAVKVMTDTFEKDWAAGQPL
jgi:phosphatidylserine/phosphatidylglycerophosphate/cardiolipin synthase-like enzyme